MRMRVRGRYAKGPFGARNFVRRDHQAAVAGWQHIKKPALSLA
jgi:hypothetical protein